MRIVIYGVGEIGQLIAKVALSKGHEVAGAIDIDPGKVGRDLGHLLGLGKELGIKVEDNADKVLAEAKPDLVVHATGSFLDKVYPQLMKAVHAGADVISTCETLAWPWYRYPGLAAKINEEALRAGVTVLGTGINPGFALDTVPIVLSASLARLERIIATRSLDASKRRYSFQRKIGLGLDPLTFKSMLSTGLLTAHVGFAESVLLIANAMGLLLDRVEEGQEAILAESDQGTQYFRVPRGTVTGIVGYGRGLMGGREVIRVELRACVGCEEYEEVRLEGEPTVTWRSTGTPGDLATAAIIVNLAPRVLGARPGLITINDLVNYSYSHGSPMKHLAE